jgi:hypothetical protein
MSLWKNSFPLAECHKTCKHSVILFWISYVPKFAQIWWEMLKTQNTSIVPSIKRNLCWTNFHEFHIWSRGHTSSEHTSSGHTSRGHLTYYMSPKQIKKYGEHRQKFLNSKSSLPCILHTESTKDQRNKGGQVQQLPVTQQTHQYFIHY